MALTATATQHVKDDIIDSLGLVRPLCVETSFDRPNLFLTASKQVRCGRVLLQASQLLLAKGCFQAKTIHNFGFERFKAEAAKKYPAFTPNSFASL